MRIIWLERALDDFAEAVTYLEERNPQAARSLAEHVNAALLSLRAFPNRADRDGSRGRGNSWLCRRITSSRIG